MIEKIAKIQDKIGKLTKDTKGYNYKYFDINQLLERLQPLLREQGLVITQPILDGCVCTMIVDVETNKQMTSMIKLPENVKPQDLGSAITYYRRYSLVSLLALEAEDDDGKKASEGLNTREWAKIRDNYQNNGIITPDDWEKCSVEQKKIITEIKKSKLKNNEQL
jgi:hypothetical protein